MTLEAAVMVDERRMMWDPEVMYGSAFFCTTRGQY